MRRLHCLAAALLTLVACGGHVGDGPDASGSRRDAALPSCNLPYKDADGGIAQCPGYDIDTWPVVGVVECPAGDGCNTCVCPVYAATGPTLDCGEHAYPCWMYDDAGNIRDASH